MRKLAPTGTLHAARQATQHAEAAPLGTTRIPTQGKINCLGPWAHGPYLMPRLARRILGELMDGHLRTFY